MESIQLADNIYWVGAIDWLTRDFHGYSTYRGTTYNAYLIIDEMHVYRGVFGSNFANLMRRFMRICNFYGSKPQIISSSATIANPKELGEKLTMGRLADFETREMLALEILGERPWISMSELAGELATAPNTTTGLITRMVERGIVKRRNSDKDRRVVEIALTAKGDEFYDEYIDLHMQYGDELLKALSDDEAIQYVDLMDKLIAKITAEKGN